MTIFVDENIPYLSQALKSIADVSTFNFKELTKEKLIKSNCEYLFTRSTIKVNSDLLDRTNVKFVGTSTIGTDHVDKEYLQIRKIHFASAPGSNANSVAEYVIFSILHWLNKRSFSPIEKTIGIVGYGNIGKLVDKHIKAIFPEMKILVNDPPLKEANFIFSSNLKYCGLDELIIQSDIITNHVPKEINGKYPTINLFNEQNLNLLKNNSLFIHASRGGVVDETCILKEKSKKEIMLSTDVWANEPYLNSELLILSEIATPHVAGHSWNGKIRGTIMMLKQFEEFSGIKVDLKEMKEFILNTEKDNEMILNEFERYEVGKNLNNNNSNEDNDFPYIRKASQLSESLNANNSTSTLYEHLKETRQIFQDTEELKSTVDLTEEERATRFDLMRRNYPKRYETLNY